MSHSLLIIGDSGSGKSTSLFPNPTLGIKGLNPEDTFIINISKKQLPFAGWRKKYKTFDNENLDGNILFSDNSKMILKAMKFVNEKRPDIKNIVIEDTNLSSSKTFFDRYNEAGWEKFNEIGGNLGQIILFKDKFRADLNSIYIFHLDTFEGPDGNKHYKTKTLGKVIEDKLTPETKFTTVLHAVKEYNPITEVNERWFYNNDYPGSPAKSPFGMFEEFKSINDVGFVLDKMKEFEECEDC